MPNAQPTLLVLHPAATLSGVWAPLRRALPERWQILASDLLPDGSPATQIARWAGAAAAQIIAADSPAHIIAASLGASVALRLALEHPALVASLTLYSGQLGGPPPSPMLRYLGRLVSGMAGGLPRRIVAAALLTQFPAYQGEDRAAVRADIVRLGTAGIIGHLRAQLAHNVQAEAANIIAPALLLAGERDPLTRSGVHRSLQAVLTRARLVEVPGAGHVTFLSHPEAILRELPLWLDQQHGHEL